MERIDHGMGGGEDSRLYHRSMRSIAAAVAVLTAFAIGCEAPQDAAAPAPTEASADAIPHEGEAMRGELAPAPAAEPAPAPEPAPEAQPDTAPVAEPAPEAAPPTEAAPAGEPVAVEPAAATPATAEDPAPAPAEPATDTATPAEGADSAEG